MLDLQIAPLIFILFINDNTFSIVGNRMSKRNIKNRPFFDHVMLFPLNAKFSSRMPV
jgi:hypothetical protein